MVPPGVGAARLYPCLLQLFPAVCPTRAGDASAPQQVAQAFDPTGSRQDAAAYCRSNTLGWGSTSWAKCWWPTRLRTRWLVLFGMALINSAPWSWQIQMLLERTARIGNGIISWWSTWRAMQSAVTQSSLIMLSLGFPKGQLLPWCLAGIIAEQDNDGWWAHSQQLI